MESEDMPDLMAVVAGGPAAVGTADDALDDADELEDLLEDALEQEFEEQDAGQATAVAPPAAPGPGSAQEAEALPRNAEGFIDPTQLTTEQRVAYNALIMRVLTEDQLDRYEAFRRSSLKDPMRRLMVEVTGQTRPNPQDKTLVALSSVAKTFVGELVEQARQVAESRGQRGPLLAVHIHAAYQRLQEEGKVETMPQQSALRMGL